MTMTEAHTASRTLVKSAPELWAECSVADSLARHLGQFGEIRITRLEPETTVAWEGTRASGTVRLEPSGWGTQVTLTAVAEVVEVGETEPEPEPEVVVEPEPAVAVGPEPITAAAPEPVTVADPEPVTVAAPEPIRAPKRRFRDRLRWFFNGPQPQAEPELAPVAVAEPEPEPVVVAEPEPEPVVVADAEPALDPGALLTAALDSLGQAHHRPFSRA
jgi:hypothetical protein